MSQQLLPNLSHKPINLTGHFIWDTLYYFISMFNNIVSEILKAVTRILGWTILSIVSINKQDYTIQGMAPYNPLKSLLESPLSSLLEVLLLNTHKLFQRTLKLMDRHTTNIDSTWYPLRVKKFFIFIFFYLQSLYH